VTAIDRLSRGAGEPFEVDAVRSMVHELRRARAEHARAADGGLPPGGIAGAVERLPGRAPSIGEVARELDLELEDLLDAVRASPRSEPASPPAADGAARRRSRSRTSPARAAR
jgi:hypothetical protein